MLRRAGSSGLTSQKVQLKNKVTDADGDKSTLTFEVWTADAAGNPLKKVSIADNEWGVIVSPYVASGTTVTVDVPVGKLALNTNYVFHTSAFDGSLYETSWSPWAKFRIELPVDLTLPTPDYSAPDPTSLNTPPNYYQTKPLGTAGSPLSARSSKSAVEQCSEADADGRQVCFGKSTPVAKGKAPKSGAKAAGVATAGVEWCNTDFESILATRFIECDVRSVPIYIRMDGAIQATAHFMFLRMLQVDGQNSFTEHLTIEPAQQIPPRSVKSTSWAWSTCARGRVHRMSPIAARGRARRGGYRARCTPRRSPPRTRGTPRLPGRRTCTSRM